jgi:hypothetical protein
MRVSPDSAVANRKCVEQVTQMEETAGYVLEIVIRKIKEMRG